MHDLAIALLHHPVLNKGGDIIGSAVTNLDLHDISRVARTYQLTDFFVATPYADQRQLISEILDHWQNGHGAMANPARKEALSLIQPAADLEAIIETLSSRYKKKVMVVATSARKQQKEIGYKELRRYIEKNESPVLLLFGTAHGLAPEVISRSDAVLAPIGIDSDYNHLSVRSEVSIILDRLLGEQRN